MGKTPEKVLKRERRQKHIRKKIFGTAEKPRLSVFKSLKHIYIQAINDDDGITIVSASTLEKEVKEAIKGLKKYDAAQKIGDIFAERLKQKSIEKAVFDRGGYPYHGRIKALAEKIREKGIKF